MRNYFKFFVLLVIVMMAMFFVACTDSNQLDNHDTTGADINSESDSVKHEPQYFFADGYLLGSYGEDGWHSLCDTMNPDINDNGKGLGDSANFYAQDLLNQDGYYVYDGKKLLGVSNQIIWITERDFSYGSFESEEAPKKLAKYGKPYYFKGQNETDFRIFDLPVKIGDELSNLEMPKYNNFTTGFVIAEAVVNDGLVTNSDVNSFPRTLTYGVEPTSEGMQALLDLFKENDMENTLPNFTECVRGDFDGDGKDEYLMIANSPREDGLAVIVSNGEKDKLGTFSAVLYQEDNGSIQIIENILEDAPETAEFINGKMFMDEWDGRNFHDIDLVTVADLNGDGNFEIIVSNGFFQCGCYLVFSQNQQGDYNTVMRADWGI